MIRKNTDLKENHSYREVIYAWRGTRNNRKNHSYCSYSVPVYKEIGKLVMVGTFAGHVDETVRGLTCIDVRNEDKHEQFLLKHYKLLILQLASKAGLWSLHTKPEICARRRNEEQDRFPLLFSDINSVKKSKCSFSNCKHRVLFQPVFNSQVFTS